MIGSKFDKVKPGKVEIDIECETMIGDQQKLLLF